MNLRRKKQSYKDQIFEDSKAKLSQTTIILSKERKSLRSGEISTDQKKDFRIRSQRTNQPSNPIRSRRTAGSEI